MKAKILILLAIFTVSLMSCSEVQPDPFTGEANDRVRNIDRVLLEHNWTFHHFWNAGMDETAPVTGFRMSFEKEGELKLTNGTEELTGEWNSTLQSTRILLDLKFDGEGVWEDLNKVWVVKEYPFPDHLLLGLEYLQNNKTDSYFLELQGF